MILKKPRLEHGVACYIDEVPWLGESLSMCDFLGPRIPPDQHLLLLSNPDLDASSSRGLVAEEEKAAVVVRGSNMVETLAIA